MASKTKQRSDAPKNYWHQPAHPVRFGDEEFRLSVLRFQHRPLVIDDYVTAFDWAEDDKSLMSGSITMQRPPGKFQVQVGNEIKCEVSRKGQNRWSEVWRMRLTQPGYQVGSGVWTFQLSDDLTRLELSKDDFDYRKDRHHPKGWPGHQVIKDVCDRYGVQVGSIPVMKHHVKKLTMTNASPVGVIKQVLKFERLDEGHRYFIKWRNGRLSVIPFKRSNALLRIAGTLIDAAYAEALSDTFATVLSVHTAGQKAKGKDTKGHKKNRKSKIVVTVQTQRGLENYGYIHRKLTAPNTDTAAEARKWGLRQLARVAKPKRTLDLTHPGIARLQRGDALMVTIPELDMQRLIVYVSAVTHNVTAGDYQMSVTCTFTDPFANDTSKKEAAKRKRCAAAKKRKRKPPKGCPQVAVKKSKRKKARQRGDGHNTKKAQNTRARG